MRIIIFMGKIFYYFTYLYKKIVNIYLQDKYYKRAKKIGKCVRFNGISKIEPIENVEIGNNVHIGDNAYISAQGGLYIGDNTHISRNLVLYTDNHNYEGKYLPYDDTFIKKKVVIEKNVWIGMNVTILPGTYIEEGAIIGAGAVVAGRVEKYSVYGAALGQIIKKRDESHYKKLENSKMYGGINGKKLDVKCIE
jgi:acetyltransferase-like isoleucine patch superfamily enzyme